MGFTMAAWCRRLACALALALTTAITPPAAAQQADALKAGFVHNFLKFTEWPNISKTDTNTPITLAIVAPPPIVEVFSSTLAGKTLRGHKLNILPLPPETAATNTSLTYHALYLAPTATNVWPDIRSNLATRPVLTISDAPHFCEAGGILHLYEKDNRFRFSANPDAAIRVELRLHSELLKLATIIKTAKETP